MHQTNKTIHNHIYNHKYNIKSKKKLIINLWFSWRILFVNFLCSILWMWFSCLFSIIVGFLWFFMFYFLFFSTISSQFRFYFWSYLLSTTIRFLRWGCCSVLSKKCRSEPYYIFSCPQYSFIYLLGYSSVFIYNRSQVVSTQYLFVVIHFYLLIPPGLLLPYHLWTSVTGDSLV